MNTPIAGNAPGKPTEEVLGKAVEDSAKHLSGLSVAFLVACVYIGIAVAATSDKVLLLGGDFELPLLKARIPLQRFYLVGPFLLVVLHVHLLLQDYFLMRRLEQWRDVLEVNHRSALMLFPALPVLRYGGWKHARIVDLLLDIILFAINAALPILILCSIQFRFVAYHCWRMTLWHQSLVLFDLWAIWYFLSKHERAFAGGPAAVAARRVGGVLLTAGVIYVVLGLAVVPGTWIELITQGPLKPRLLDRNLSFGEETIVAQLPSPEVVAHHLGKGESIEDAYRWHSVGVSLAGRDLRGARFDGTKLFNADLRNADLRHTAFVDVDLRGGELTGAMLQDATLHRVILVGVNLSYAQLQRAELHDADLRAVEAYKARFNRAQLRRGRLRGARLRRAFLIGTDLVGVLAQGADFANAQLEGAQLTGATLVGADFSGANTKGADFRQADLRGATGLAIELVDLRGAHLGGACGLTSHVDSDLRAADFVLFTAGQWDQQIRVLRKILPEANERVTIAVERLARAKRANMTIADQARCLAMGANSTTWWPHGLLYDDAQRVGPMQRWPEAWKQNPDRRGIWDERAYYQRFVRRLLERACNNGPLAWTLAKRAARNYNPGDETLDQAFSEALARELSRPTPCKEIRKLPADLRRQVLLWDRTGGLLQGPQ